MPSLPSWVLEATLVWEIPIVPDNPSNACWSTRKWYPYVGTWMTLLAIPVHEATQSPMLTGALNPNLVLEGEIFPAGQRETSWKSSLWETLLYFCGWQRPPCACSGLGDVPWSTDLEKVAFFVLGQKSALCFAANTVQFQGSSNQFHIQRDTGFTTYPFLCSNRLLIFQCVYHIYICLLSLRYTELDWSSCTPGPSHILTHGSLQDAAY